MLEWILAFSFGAVLLVVMAIVLAAPPVQHDPLPPDEEVRWLMEDCGLSREEAEEIADMGRY